MRVRAAVPADAEAIATVHVRGWQEGYAHVFPADRLAAISVAERASRWRARLASGVPIVVAEQAGEIVGFATVGTSRDEDAAGAGELYGIYVSPDAWGQGIGRTLMERALADLRRNGFEEATLWVLEDNPRARRFYECGGWAHDGTVQDEEFLETPVREVRYRISLR